MVANLVSASSVIDQGDLGATTTANTMTTSPAPTPVQGNLYTITVTNAQTSATPTLNGVTIVKRAATALASGDMPAGATALLRFNGSVFQLLNPVVP